MADTITAGSHVVSQSTKAMSRLNETMIHKGDTFVQYHPRHTMIFMKVNDVEHAELMDFCTVTWHMLDANGLNVQRRFPMAAIKGEFMDFTVIPRKVYKEAVTLMLDSDAKIKVASSDPSFRED